MNERSQSFIKISYPQFMDILEAAGANTRWTLRIGSLALARVHACWCDDPAEVQTRILHSLMIRDDGRSTTVRKRYFTMPESIHQPAAG